MLQVPKVEESSSKVNFFSLVEIGSPLIIGDSDTVTRSLHSAVKDSFTVKDLTILKKSIISDNHCCYFIAPMCCMNTQIAV